MSTIVSSLRHSFDDIKESLSALSLLGRAQMLILLGNSVLTCVVLNAAGSYRTTGGDRGGQGGSEPTEGSVHHVDAITLAISLTFTLSTIIGLIYTVRVESAYAFVALVVLQVEQAAFVTAAAAGGVLATPWARWLVVGANLASIALFLGLQFVVRQAWGWHAYKAIGGNTESIRVYQQYQRLAAALYLDIVHTILFIIAEEIVIRSRDPAQWARVYCATVPCLVLGFFLLWAVRNDLRPLSLALCAVFCGGFIVEVYYTLINSVGALASDLSNLGYHTDFSGRDQALMVVTIEWCALIARAVFLIVCVRVATAVGYRHLLGTDRGAYAGDGGARRVIHSGGGGGADSRYLINPTSEECAFNTRTMSSIASSAPWLGGGVRQVAIIDTSHQARSLLDRDASPVTPLD